MLVSDQFLTWSDENIEADHSRLAKAPPSAPAPIAPAQSCPSGFPHRTLQTLWQARMQVRRRPRSWPQVLPVGELSRLAPTNGLRPARVLRAGERVPGQLPPRPPDLRGDLRDQPRAPASPRGALKHRHERSAVIQLEGFVGYRGSVAPQTRVRGTDACPCGRSQRARP